MRIDTYVSDRQKKRKRRRVYFYGAIVVLALYFIIAGVLWLVFRSPFFRVNNIVVRGNDTVSSDAVISLLESSALHEHGTLDAFLGQHNMFFWPDGISPDDMRFIPALANVSVDKDYFTHTVTLNVTERTPFAIWCLMSKAQGGVLPGDEQCYWIDNTGTAFRRAFDTQGSLLFAVHDYSDRNLGLSQKILPGDFPANAISILSVLRQSGLKVNEVALKDFSLEELDVTTFNGPALYFSLRFPADNYLPVVKDLMGRSGFDKLQYIDCTTVNRVYYK